MADKPGAPGGEETAMGGELVGRAEGGGGEGAPVVMDLGEGPGEKDGEFLGAGQPGDLDEGGLDLGGGGNATEGLRGERGKAEEGFVINLGRVGERIVAGLRRGRGVDLAKELGGLEGCRGADLDGEAVELEVSASARRRTTSA